MTCEFQNGSLKGRGCQDGNYTLRSTTELRRTHNLGTWALFVDLRKAFDTADHNLLHKLLEIYGAPAEATSSTHLARQTPTRRLRSQTQDRR